MKIFDRILAVVLALAALLIVGINIFGRYFGSSEQARAYRVEIYRIAAQIEREGLGAVSCYYWTVSCPIFIRIKRSRKGFGHIYGKRQCWLWR